MIKPTAGPCLFETRALGYLARAGGQAPGRWFRRYADLFPVCLAPVTVTDQLRGYTLLLERAEPSRAPMIAAARDRYLEQLASGAAMVLPAGATEALVAAQLAVLVPFSPSPPYRVGSQAESRQDRLARWRSQMAIAAAALARGIPLVHDNPGDFDHLAALVENFPERFPGIGVPAFVWARKLV
ncbi:MAG TPA: hypothetical protein VN442_11040 [Bryobacteraceae bacterium]|nr:hypothetical protein [Bryobacteraceae bacterium]